MDVKFNSPLMHYIQLPEVKDNRRDVMTFNLNGTIVMLNNDDFLLMTGLWLTPNLKWASRVECEL